MLARQITDIVNELICQNLESEERVSIENCVEALINEVTLDLTTDITRTTIKEILNQDIEDLANSMIDLEVQFQSLNTGDECLISVTEQEV
mmetsp:Transcript_22816/g.17267  ORF Transcript_22816/g.17267 Transcript_22816/m.17267 type:complete len:91 (+) Transcript_22816:150-422(+)